MKGCQDANANANANSDEHYEDQDKEEVLLGTADDNEDKIKKKTETNNSQSSATNRKGPKLAPGSYQRQGDKDNHHGGKEEKIKKKKTETNNTSSSYATTGSEQGRGDVCKKKASAAIANSGRRKARSHDRHAKKEKKKEMKSEANNSCSSATNRKGLKLAPGSYQGQRDEDNHHGGKKKKMKNEKTETNNTSSSYAITGSEQRQGQEDDGKENASAAIVKSGRREAHSHDPHANKQKKKNTETTISSSSATSNGGPSRPSGKASAMVPEGRRREPKSKRTSPASPKNATTKNDLKDSTKPTLVLAAGTHGESNDAPIRAHASRTRQYRTLSVGATNMINDSDDEDEEEEESAPGAVHIPGSMGDWNIGADEVLPPERLNQAQDEERLQDNHDASLVVAVLAPSEADIARQVEEQVEHKVTARLEAERQNQDVVAAVEVEVEGVRNPRKRKLVLLLGIASIVLVGVVVSVVVPNASPSLSQSTASRTSPSPTLSPSSSPTSPRLGQLLLRIGSNVTSDVNALVTNSTRYQFAALDWLANTDPANLDLASTPTFVLVERYVMALLYFATNGENWGTRFGFLTASSVCLWHAENENGFPRGISCHGSSGSSLSSIILEDNGLSGRLPTELALLSSLTTLAFFPMMN